MCSYIFFLLFDIFTFLLHKMQKNKTNKTKNLLFITSHVRELVVDIKRCKTDFAHSNIWLLANVNGPLGYNCAGHWKQLPNASYVMHYSFAEISAAILDFGATEEVRRVYRTVIHGDFCCYDTAVCTRGKFNLWNCNGNQEQPIKLYYEFSELRINHEELTISSLQKVERQSAVSSL